jgi:hypothetical protein
LVVVLEALFRGHAATIASETKNRWHRNDNRG